MSKVDDEAVGLWLARQAQAPEAWRTRANSAAALLSTAAAATLLSLVLAPGRLPTLNGTSRALLALAAISYIVAVVAYLVASVWGYPQRKGGFDNYANESQRLYKQESLPIRRLVFFGTGAAIVAIVATGLAVVFVATSASTVTARLVLTPDALRGIQTICSDYDASDHVRVQRVEQQYIIELVRGQCQGTPATVRLDSAKVIALVERQ